MNVATLIEDALEERGNAVAVIARPADGEAATIHYANGVFARAVGVRADRLPGLRLGALQGVAEDPADWTAFVGALRGPKPALLEIKLLLGERHSWFRFGISFRGQGGADYATIIGRDTTEIRRSALAENEQRHLLASVFLRISVPVVIVRACGTVIMANPAFLRMLGYEQREAPGLNVADLTAPEYTAETVAARARQLRDGQSYEMRIETLTKSGVRVRVKLTSVLLRDADQRLRVVTLIPEFQDGPDIADAEAVLVRPRSVGEVQAISLTAWREAFGPEWERVAPRAMARAEQVVKRRLAAADVFSRNDDRGFVVWFDSTDAARNALALAGIVREIRLAFVTEFGEAVAGAVSGVTVDGMAGEPGKVSQAVVERVGQARGRGEADARALLARLGMVSAAEVSPVSDREGRVRPMAVVDFACVLQPALLALSTGRPQGQDGEIDLIRLDHALRELGARPGSVLVRLGWASLTQPDRRRALEARLARLALEDRARVMLAIGEVPPLPSAKRWSEMVAPLRHQVSEVGLAVALAAGDKAAVAEAIVADWPITLVMIDGVQPGVQPPDAHFGLIGAARGRGIAVLVRTPEADRRDWRELGATLFAVAK